MPGYAFDQPLKNERGVSLLETMIALALVVILTGMLAGLFGAGIKSFTYSTRLTTALANARKALDGGSSSPGMAWQARQALSVSELSASRLTLNLPNGTTPQYGLSGQTLNRSTADGTTSLATQVTGLQLAYYNIDSSGLIMVSTSAAFAGLVTAWVQTRQTGQKTYTFYSAGRLRNGP